jgi:hypothetical protein
MERSRGGGWGRTEESEMNWLIFEGLAPLFGASVIFVLMGAARRAVHNPNPPTAFKYAWGEALSAFNLSGSAGLGLLALALLPAAPLALPIAAAAVGGMAGLAITRRLQLDEPQVMFRSDGAQYINVRFNPTRRGHTFEVAVEHARKYAREQSKVLYVSIRRTDLPGHPWVCEWTRKEFGDPWTSTWTRGAFCDPAQAKPGDAVPALVDTHEVRAG